MSDEISRANRAQQEEVAKQFLQNLDEEHWLGKKLMDFMYTVQLVRADLPYGGIQYQKLDRIYKWLAGEEES